MEEADEFEEQTERYPFDDYDDAFYDMLEAFKEYNIPYVGAGKNIEEAKKPYYFIINGYKIAFVNATRAEKIILTPEATETEGGVLRCYDPTLSENRACKGTSRSALKVCECGNRNALLP